MGIKRVFKREVSNLSWTKEKVEVKEEDADAAVQRCGKRIAGIDTRRAVGRHMQSRNG